MFLWTSKKPVFTHKWLPADRCAFPPPYKALVLDQIFSPMHSTHELTNGECKKSGQTDEVSCSLYLLNRSYWGTFLSAIKWVWELQHLESQRAKLSYQIMLPLSQLILVKLHFWLLSLSGGLSCDQIGTDMEGYATQNWSADFLSETIMDCAFSLDLKSFLFSSDLIYVSQPLNIQY